MKIIKNKRILALIGIVGLTLGCFLPYYTVSILGFTQSISLSGYLEGKIILVLTLANTLFIFQDCLEKYGHKLFDNWVGNLVRKANNPKFAIVPTILVAVFVISLVVRLDVNSDYIKYGLGFWLLWLGIIALIGHSVFYKKQNVESVQTVQDSMQEPMQQPVQQPVQEPMQQPVQEPMQQPVQEPMQQSIDPTKKYCPQCRTQVDVNADTCFMCGSKF